jgi:hypothetical protein
MHIHACDIHAYGASVVYHDQHIHLTERRKKIKKIEEKIIENMLELMCTLAYIHAIHTYIHAT